ncbi:MAG: SpaA isopeptide-forming pilin-related protein [Faecalimonas sp.]|nr:SpaA isopeptide-forming pilin-related protein [Faecalimonas sp.]
MKRMKKIAGLVLALVMAFAMTTSVFAAGEGSIAINNATVGQEYSVYRIFDLESYSGNAYSYTVNSSWSAFVEQSSIKGAYVNIDASGYVTWVDGADVADFAKAAIAYAETNSVAATKTDTATSATLSFTGLDLGYYLVDSTVGTLCGLDTTAPSAIINDKNGLASSVKKVQEDSTGEFGAENDADITDVVTFQTTITAQAGAENYVLHDTMSAGLTFGSVTGITLQKGQGTPTTVATSNYEVKTSGLSNGETFNVVFAKAFTDTLAADDKLVVTYTATLNANAVIGAEGNTNKTFLSFGDAQDLKTTETSTTTKTWAVEIFKYTGTDTPLAGADFKLYKEVGNAKKWATVANGKLTGWVDAEASATVLTSGADGKIKVEGLDADSYFLKETKAPTGYNKLASDVAFTIDGNVDVKVVTVENKAGTLLPITGDMGTAIFYWIGFILVSGTVILLITKKRMSAK